MKIFLLITKANVGGAQMSVINLARELKNQGHNITVGSGDGEFLYNELKQSNIPTVKFNKLKRTHNPFQNLGFIKEFKNYLDLNQFDIVHINSSNALVGAHAAKKSKYIPRTVFTYRGLSMLDKNYNKNNILKFIYKRFFTYFSKFIDVPVFVSNSNYDYALKKGISKNGKVIYNGLDQNINFYDRNKVRGLLSTHLQADLKGKFIIGSIGRLCYAKNYEFLLNAMPDILKIKPQAVALIIGSGKVTPEYKKIIKKNNLEGKVYFAGKLHNAAKYLKAYELITLTSRYEGMPITLIEALIAGVPILSSRVGGIEEMLNNNIHQLYELDNKNDFLNKFLDLSTNHSVRVKCRKSNLELAKEYDIKKTANQYLSIYKK